MSDKTFAGALALGLLAMALPRPARAANDDGVLLGNDAALTGGAVAATVQDGSALWYDPAGLAAVTRSQADVSASAFVLRAYSLPALLASQTGERADRDHLELVSVPGALTFVRPLGARLRLGAGLFVPEAAETSARVRLDVVQPEGTASWNLTVDESSRAYYGAVGLAVRLGARLRVGLALFGVYRQLSGFVQLWGGGAATTGERAFVGYSALVSLQSVGVEAGLGVQWQPVPALHLGLSLRSPGLELATHLGATTFTGVAGVDATGMSTIAFEPGEDDRLQPSVGLRTPARLRLGVAWSFPRGWVSLEADVQHALRDVELGVDHRFVWNARAGGRVQVSPAVALGLGVFTDRSSEPSPSQFGDSRLHFYGVAGGIELRSGHSLARTEESRDIVFSTTIGFRYALGLGQVGGLELDRQSHTSVVRIDGTVHEVTFHLGSGLYF